VLRKFREKAIFLSTGIYIAIFLSTGLIAVVAGVINRVYYGERSQNITLEHTYNNVNLCSLYIMTDMEQDSQVVPFMNPTLVSILQKSNATLELAMANQAQQSKLHEEHVAQQNMYNSRVWETMGHAMEEIRSMKQTINDLQHGEKVKSESNIFTQAVERYGRTFKTFAWACTILYTRCGLRTWSFFREGEHGGNIYVVVSLQAVKELMIVTHVPHKECSLPKIQSLAAEINNGSEVVVPAKMMRIFGVHPLKPCSLSRRRRQFACMTLDVFAQLLRWVEKLQKACTSACCFLYQHNELILDDPYGFNLHNLCLTRQGCANKADMMMRTVDGDNPKQGVWCRPETVELLEGEQMELFWCALPVLARNVPPSHDFYSDLKTYLANEDKTLLQHWSIHEELGIPTPRDDATPELREEVIEQNPPSTDWITFEQLILLDQNSKPLKKKTKRITGPELVKQNLLTILCECGKDHPDDIIDEDSTWSWTTVQKWKKVWHEHNWLSREEIARYRADQQEYDRVDDGNSDGTD
jgi:hypothetical protein